MRLADDYAREVLGHIRYAPWLYVYSALTGAFKEGWIPDNYYGSVVVPSFKGSYGKISSLKAFTNLIFRSDAFPDLAYYANGLFLTPGGSPIAVKDIGEFLFDGREEVVFKVDNSMQGKGIFFLTRKLLDVGKIRSLGNGVFQKRIVQHEIFDEFAPKSVATLRITTAVDDDGAISVRACYLRLGRSADTHVQSATHVRVPVNLSNGELFREGYLTNWHTIEEHPDTKARFSGVKVPAFSECLSTVLDHHGKVRFVRCIGWDVAIDGDDSVRLMEWNAEHNDIKFSEPTQGPCFADLKWERLAREPRLPN
jgi:hypothetical protein